MIRAARSTELPLILLHGGPGWSETRFFRRFNASLETAFTVVYWDQRGAGKSYQPGIPRSSMTVEQFISDLDELVDAVCDRLGTGQVAILGHSWGSVLGALYAARHPEKVVAYIGCAQIGNWPEAEAASYTRGLIEAQRQGDRRALRKLRDIGPPPYGADAVFTERTCTMRLAGGMRLRELPKTARALFGRHESSVFGVATAWRGFRFTMDAMWPEVSRLNVVQLVPALQMPVWFPHGRNDPWIPAETSNAYFNELTAPAKKLVWFEHSGHEPFVDEPDKFNRTMIEVVRPAILGQLAAAGLSGRS